MASNSNHPFRFHWRGDSARDVRGPLTVGSPDTSLGSNAAGCNDLREIRHEGFPDVVCLLSMADFKMESNEAGIADKISAIRTKLQWSGTLNPSYGPLL